MQLDPRRLPDPITLRRRAQALAMLDAIVCPEWEDRCYSFNAAWGDDLQMGSMRNGQGDDWFILFGPFGTAIKGLAHETPIAGDKAYVDAVQKTLPVDFAPFFGEPAFSMDWLSYCYWRRPEDDTWHKVVHADPLLSKGEDGSVEFLALLVEGPAAYGAFAEWYYECELPAAAIEQVCAHAPLTEELVRLLNPELGLDEVRACAEEIGYPMAA